MFINPDINAIIPDWYKGAKENFKYLYSTKQNSGTFLWLSEFGQIIVDMKAGPVVWKNINHDEGNINSEIYTKYYEGRDMNSQHSILLFIIVLYENPGLLSKICVLTINAIENVFCSDIPYDYIHEKNILLPLVIFFNHNDINPVADETSTFINYAKIIKELSKTILPHQQLTIIPMAYPIQYDTYK